MTLSRSAIHHLACASASTALGYNEDTKHFLRAAFDEDISALTCYEIILQSYLFAGFPAAIEGMAILADVCKERSIVLEFPTHTYDLAAFQERGEALCKTIYTTSYSTMRSRFETMSPDLNAWMILEGYGKTLSRPHADILLREYCIVAMLIVLRRTNQLYSHIHGAKHCGAARHDIEMLVHYMTAMPCFAHLWNESISATINTIITSIFASKE